MFLMDAFVAGSSPARGMCPCSSSGRAKTYIPPVFSIYPLFKEWGCIITSE